MVNATQQDGNLELAYSEKGEGDELRARWDDYRFFLAIAKAASLKQASAALKTTQSAVSKRIDRLERDLGVRLFDRGPKGTTLTFHGQRVLRYALSAQRELTRAHAEALAAETRVEGDVSLLMGDGVANYWMPVFLETFLDLYPNIEIRAILDHDATAPRNEVFDIRLHYYVPNDPAQVSKALATVHFMLFASKAYIARHGTPRSKRELANHRTLDQMQYLMSGAWNTWFDGESVKATSLLTNQGAFLAKCVKAGVGIAMMPTYIGLSDPDFVPLDFDPGFALKLYVSYHRERAQKLPVKMLLSFLRTRVFDQKRMPWFTEEFVAPRPEWKQMLALALDAARKEKPFEGAGAEE